MMFTVISVPQIISIGDAYVVKTPKEVRKASAVIDSPTPLTAAPIKTFVTEDALAE